MEQPEIAAVDDAPALPPSSNRSNSTSSSESGSSSSGSSESSQEVNDNGGQQGEEGGTNGRSSSADYPAVIPPPPPAVNTLCRICMCDPAEDGRMLESLFRTTVDSKTLYAMLVTVVPLGQGNNDGMPDKVCTSCKGKLVQAYRLYETCVKSDERLRKLLQLQNSAGGVLIKQEIIDEDDEDVELANFQLYCDAQVKKEDEYDQDYLFDGGFYGVGLAAAHYNTPNLRIQSVHNGPEVLVQLQEGLDAPSQPAVEWDKYVKVTPNGHHCILCGKDFKYFSYFKQHAIAQHDPSKPHKCHQCKYTFKTEQRLFLHMRTHLEQQAEELPLAVEHAELPEPELEIEGTLDLDQSEDSIVDDESVSISINPDNGEKIYTCLICQKQLTTLPLYRRHQTVHTVRGRPFECEICHYRFAMKFSYNAHMLRHEQGKDPAQPAAYKCAECPQTFVRRKLLNLHVAVNHEKPTVYLNRTAPAAILTSNISEGRGGHACPICSETFNRESVLNNHMKMHELEAAQLKHSEVCYICNVCGVECETRDSFTTHIKTHGDDIALEHQNNSMDVDDDEDDPAMPPTPQNGATDPLSTSTPTSKPEPKSGVRCELCSKTFPYACNLKQHRIIHHSELKPHECHICHYRFEYEGTLMRHMQKHSKQELSAASTTPTSIPSLPQPEDPIVAPAGASLVFKCKLCSARFQKQKSMTWHLKTHRSIVAAGEDKEASPTKELGSPLSPNSAATASANAFAARLDLKPQQQPQSTSSSSTALQQIQQLQQAALRGMAAAAARGAKMYKCGYCPQKLDSEDAYYQHLKGHRVRPATDPLQPDEETPPAKKKRSWVRSGEHHKCHLCQKVFTFRSQLQQHTALHHQPGKPYECGKCHYSFVHKLNLKRHELTHLEEERVSAEDDPSIQLLEDESFNAEELAEPDEMSPAVVGLMPVNRGGVGSEAGDKQSGEGVGPPKRNKCVVCAATFQREDQLIEHLKTHIERMKVTKQETQSAKKILTDDSDKKCKLCAKVFKFSCQLKQHIQMHHSKDKPFECNICRYRFEFKGHMLRHKANNHPDELAAEEADADELPAKITTPTVNPDGSEVYQCPVCPMNFVKQRSLTWHLKTHSGAGSGRKVKREDGGGGGIYPSASSSSSTGEVFQCRVCTRLFNDAYELKAHMLTHAGSSTSSSGQVIEADHSLFGSGLDMMLQDFPDTMEDTDPLFDGSNLELVLEDNFDHDLDFSMRYNQPQDTPSSLPQTRRSLPTGGMGNDSSVYDMAEPGASTTPAKGKIVCELCKKDFLYSCNLKQHMQLHHAKEKPFECKICFYRFEYSGHLVRHIRTNHDNQQEDAIGDAIERNFVCTFCSELFEQKSQLNSHIQTYHRGEKQFKCDLCPASFAYKKTFENHREEHHSIKPGEPSAAPFVAAAVVAPLPSVASGSANFSCNLCKKTFSSAQKVDNHVCFQ
uniref:Zinc finger protein 91 n=3 Tax=Culex pipiens TaxID=7175 RepID=A0A8D8PBW7_CULPI